MNKKKLAIAFGTTTERSFAAGTLLVALNKIMNYDNYDVVIYVQGECNDYQIFKNIFNCNIIQYEFPIKEISMKKFKRISEMSFARLECFNLLSEYENVIWLDTDIVLLKDISSILNDLREGIGMYVHDRIPMSVSFKNPVPGYDMDVDCYNAGIIAVSDKLENHEVLSDWCYNCTKDYYDYINSEQAVLNMMIQFFKLNPKKLDIRFNCPPKLQNGNTVIIHTWGYEKFWNSIYNSVWEGNFKNWKRIGGSYKNVEPYYLRRIKVIVKTTKRWAKKKYSALQGFYCLF